MNFSIGCIIITLFFGTFFLVPERTALKTALRYKVSSRDILSRFSKFNPWRIVLSVSGLTLSIGFGILEITTVFYISSILTLVFLYTLDFLLIENIANKLGRCK